MNTLIFIALIWGICKLLSAASRKAKADRAERERERIRQEQQRIREEQARAREWQREAARRQAEHDKAIARATKEREALRKEQARQAAAIEKQAAEMERMKHVLEQATADIDFLQERSAELHAQLDYILLQQSATIPGSKEHSKYQSKIVTLHNQIHTAESKMSRAQFNAQQAQQKLSA